MLNRWSFNYGRKRRMAHTIARHSRWVVSYRFLESVRERNQCPIGLVESSGCLCSMTQLIWKLHTSFSSDMCLLEWGINWIDEGINAFMSVFIAWHSPLLSKAGHAGWSPFRPWLSGATIQKNLGADRQKTMHKPRNDRGSVTLVGG